MSGGYKLTFFNIFIIAVALSLDACGVALSIGINSLVTKKQKILFSISFAFFQLLFSFLGAYFGFLFNTYIIKVPKIIGGMIISIVGVFMIKEGFSKDKKEEKIFFNPGIYIVLGISVSIDALVIGFTALNSISGILNQLFSCLFIGAVTYIMSSISFFLAKKLKRIKPVKKYSSYIAGAILIIFGLKIMLF